MWAPKRGAGALELVDIRAPGGVPKPDSPRAKKSVLTFPMCLRHQISGGSCMERG